MFKMEKKESKCCIVFFVLKGSVTTTKSIDMYSTEKLRNNVENS